MTVTTHYPVLQFLPPRLLFDHCNNRRIVRIVHLRREWYCRIHRSSWCWSGYDRDSNHCNILKTKQMQTTWPQVKTNRFIAAAAASQHCCLSTLLPFFALNLKLCKLYGASMISTSVTKRFNSPLSLEPQSSVYFR